MSAAVIQFPCSAQVQVFEKTDYQFEQEQAAINEARVLKKALAEPSSAILIALFAAMDERQLIIAEGILADFPGFDSATDAAALLGYAKSERSHKTLVLDILERMKGRAQ